MSLFFLIFSLACFSIFIYLSGGLRYYLTALARTGVLTAGKMYLVAGIFSIKFFFFSQIISYFQKEKKNKFFLFFSFFLTAFLLTIFGRLHFIIFIIQLILLFYLIKKEMKKRLLAFGLISILIILFGYGEYRVFTGIAREKNLEVSFSGFVNYLKKENIPKILLQRTFLNYIDGNYTLLDTISKIDKGEISIQGGKSYLGLLLQPLPRFLRTPLLKGISPKEEMAEPGFGYGRVNSILGTTFLNFHYFGAILMALFGFLVSFVQNDLLSSLNFKKNFYGIIIYPHILSQIRASLVTAFPLLLIDLIYSFLFLSSTKKLTKNYEDRN